MSDASLSRSFVLTVRSSPERVVVEDVRGQRRFAAPDVAAAGAQIERRLSGAPEEPPSPAAASADGGGELVAAPLDGRADALGQPG